MEIAVVGAGYVGLGNAALLATHHKIKVIDIDEKKVHSLNKGVCPLDDRLMKSYLKKYKKNISADTKINENFNRYSFCIIATPTNFIQKFKSFDTSSIIEILENLKKIKYKKTIIIRSTVPIGFCDSVTKRYKNLNIAFFPEFLREGFALYDNLNPTRIIAGGNKVNTKDFANILLSLSKKKNTELVFASLKEAESIKLFANAYLATRIAFFNELDSFALTNNLDSEKIIRGISKDSRIGDYYNNPSFGYGGYCLPKDTKQLSESIGKVHHEVIDGAIASNKSRKKLIVSNILKSNKTMIGLYRLSTKSGSDNFRESAMIDILKMLKMQKKQILIYEPNYDKSLFMGYRVERSLDEFLKMVNIIIANRIDKNIAGTKKQIFSRDLFNEN